MSEDYLEKIEELMAQSDAYAGEAGIACLQEAARLADLHNDVEAGMYVRYQIVHEGTFASLIDHALVAFTWMLAKVDENAELENQFSFDLMWMLKWVAEQAPESPRLSRAQMESLVNDMERRYQERGLSMRAVEGVRSINARLMGEREAAKEHLLKARTFPDDAAADCLACQTNTEVEMLVFIGELDEAVRVAEPIRRGRQSCAEVPALTASALMMPLFDAGQLAEGDEWQRLVQRRISCDGELVDVAGQSIAFLVCTDQLRRATNLMDKKLKFVFESVAPLSQLQFCMGCSLLCKYLLVKGRPALKLKPFSAMPWSADEEGRYDVAEMSEWFNAQAADLAGQFDRRNGNDFYTRLLAENEARLDRIQPLPKAEGVKST